MKNNNLNSIIFGTVFGLLAGITGALFINLNSISDLNNLNFNREVNFNDYGYLSPNLVIRDPKKVVVSQDVKVDETIRDIQGSLLGVFTRNDDYYDLEKPYTQAVAATSDGWVMALWPEKTLNTISNKDILTYVIVDSQREVYDIDQIIVGSNEMSNLVFFHLDKADTLTVKRLLPEEEIKLGQSLILATINSSYILDSLSQKSFDAYYLNSDQYEQNIVLACNQEKTPAIAFNLSGEILGLIDREGNCLLSPTINAYWRTLLYDNVLERASLGLNYVDLSLVIPSSDDLPDKGALITSIDKTPALVKGGVAEKAGLQEGDIITRFNGIEINKDNNLSSLILTYNPGDTVFIYYLRDGAEGEAEVVLGSI